MCYTVFRVHSLKPRRVPWWEVCSYAVWGIVGFLIYRHLSVPGATWEHKLTTAFVSALLALFAPMILILCLGQLIAFLALDLVIVAAPFIWTAKLLKAIWSAASGQKRVEHRHY